MLCWCMKMQGSECPRGGIMCVGRGVPVGVRWRRLGPRPEHTQALCGPCVSRTGLSPPVCGRRSRAELHIRDIRQRMLPPAAADRKSTRLSSHTVISYAVFCLKKKKKKKVAKLFKKIKRKKQIKREKKNSKN